MWVKECCKAQPSILLQRSPNNLRPFLPLIGLRFLETCGPTWYPPRSLERKCWIFSVWKQPAGTCCAVSFFHESCFHYITVETVRCLVCTSHCLLYFLHLTTCLQSWGEGGRGGFLKSYMPLVAALSESESDDTQATLISVLLELSLTTSERLHLRDDCFSSLKLVKHFWMWVLMCRLSFGSSGVRLPAEQWLKSTPAYSWQPEILTVKGTVHCETLHKQVISHSLQCKTEQRRRINTPRGRL